MSEEKEESVTMHVDHRTKMWPLPHPLYTLSLHGNEPSFLLRQKPHSFYRVILLLCFICSITLVPFLTKYREIQKYHTVQITKKALFVC